ncbi:THUMP domain-containing class I SAM-dependent RNA methyltransferase [Alicyclobacillus tolerans]|uniref:N6-adenine-specific DNA methylase n=2 Tax=Alicyclobacillus tolerans TaxID=90970 RepID=A0ABT9LTT6_9BACL|nr:MULTISPECIES: class I SAM-dependent RNA methyltransferase [Alicyclobacillus]MDP9727677.1 putative N6-adenine-specific DNA methylase [Alicyclobacillus tengchongensis]SHK76545.1 putative N6-adenine-specific DNA methylase [Alicyclobacillus montanus]
MFQFIATAAFGLESVVARELHNLGFENTQTMNGYVEFTGPVAALVYANLWLRTADRVYIKLAEFEARTFEQLFTGTKEIRLKDWLTSDARFPVTGRSVQSQLHSVPACQSIVKKALVETMREQFGVYELPENGPLFAFTFVLHKNQCQIWLDSSGIGLHKRGYRKLTATAPLRETLAAGLVLLSRWQGHRPLLDPLCGSGTIAIEAAMIGRNQAPGLRRSFASEEWPALTPQIWQMAREEARESRRQNVELNITASDYNADVLSYAEYHARQAGVGEDVKIYKKNITDVHTNGEFGCIITNPPYGERMGERAELPNIYRELSRMKQENPNWSVFVITSDRSYEQYFQAPIHKRRKLYNGRLETQFYQNIGPLPPRPDDIWLQTGPNVL